MKYLLALLAASLLSGCVASYQHQSDPRIAGDGYDLICLGAEHDQAYIRVRGDICGNVAPNGGEVFRLSVEYRFKRPTDGDR